MDLVLVLDKSGSMSSYASDLNTFASSVLDEFDVFMDDTYRKQAVDTLMELCDQQTHRQFLFVTPQDMYPFLKHREEHGLCMPRITKMNDVR